MLTATYYWERYRDIKSKQLHTFICFCLCTDAHTHITHTVLSFIWAFFNEYPEIQLRNRWIFFCFQLCNCNWPHITTTDKLFHFHLSWISLSFAVVLSHWRCHSVNEYILPVQRHKFSNYPFNLLFLIEFRIVNNTKSLSFDLNYL